MRLREVYKAVDLWLFMKRTQFILWRFEQRDKLRLLLHCRKGYHRFTDDSASCVTFNGATQKERTIYRYKAFRCVTCGLTIFPTEKDKKQFELRLKHETAQTKKLVDLTMKAMRKKKK